MRSRRNVFSKPSRWQWAITYAKPSAWSTRRGVILRTQAPRPPLAYTIVKAQFLANAIASGANLAGGSIGKTGASAKVRGGESLARSATVLTMGRPHNTFRKTSFTYLA